MKIKPFVVGAETLFIEGKVLRLPMQAFALPDGRACIRLGENAFFFSKEGEYDGNEARFMLDGAMSDDALRRVGDEYQASLHVSIDTLGKAPPDFYFEEDSPAGKAERALVHCAPKVKPPREEMS